MANPSGRFIVIRKACLPEDEGRDDVRGSFDSRQEAMTYVLKEDDNGKGYFKINNFVISEIKEVQVDKQNSVNQVGTIPASNALTEANPASLSEAISRFDSHIQAGTTSSSEAKSSLTRIVAGLREQRIRWEAAEVERPSRTRSTSAKAPLGRKISASLDDIGL